MSAGLKLRAQSRDDLEIIAACMQDAVMKRGDLALVAEQATFVMLTNRYVWEEAAQQQRIRSGLRFRNVIRVRQKAIPADPEHLLYLLTIQYEPEAQQICLVFAENAEIRLDVEDCEVILEDIGTAWAARRQPRHGAEGEPT